MAGRNQQTGGIEVTRYFFREKSALILRLRSEPALSLPNGTESGDDAQGSGIRVQAGGGRILCSPA